MVACHENEKLQDDDDVRRTTVKDEMRWDEDGACARRDDRMTVSHGHEMR